jgi:hypothetical protein
MDFAANPPVFKKQNPEFLHDAFFFAIKIL